MSDENDIEYLKGRMHALSQICGAIIGALPQLWKFWGR